MGRGFRRSSRSGLSRPLPFLGSKQRPCEDADLLPFAHFVRIATSPCCWEKKRCGEIETDKAIAWCLEGFSDLLTWCRCFLLLLAIERENDALWFRSPPGTGGRLAGPCRAVGCSRFCPNLRMLLRRPGVCFLPLFGRRAQAQLFSLGFDNPFENPVLEERTIPRPAVLVASGWRG